MTITPDGQEGSQLPPSQRDLVRPEDFLRAHSRNLRTLGEGFAGGRLITPRAVTSLADSEDDSSTDDGNPADDTQYEWEWGDRYTVVTATGDQVVHLTYVPVEESLFVFWHPAGGGGLPITNEHFTLVDNVVTLRDPGVLAVGDEFSFQYMFDPGVIPEPGLTELVLRDVSFTPTGAAGNPGLPPLAEVGDTLVIAAMYEGVMATADPRFTKVTPAGGVVSGVMYIGVLTDLSPVVFTGTVQKMVMAAFVGSAASIGSATDFDSPYPASVPNVPSIAGTLAVAAVFQATSVVPGLAPTIAAPYVAAVFADGTTNFHALISIYYWFDDSASVTPAAACAFSGAVDAAQASVISLGPVP